MNGSRCWLVGAPGAFTGPVEVQVALTVSDVGSGRSGVVVPFHDVVGQSPAWTVASQQGGTPEVVHIGLPPFRGKRFVAVLAWLVATRLAGPGVRVVWHIDKQQGPASVQRLLEDLGWELSRAREGKATTLEGPAPTAQPAPDPRSFHHQIVGTQLDLVADYGVFSPGQVDDGSELLIEVTASVAERVDVVADIGTGYGPVAIDLVRRGLAGRAVATDVDSVALWLAASNAEHAGVDLDTRWTPDPEAVEATALTVCNVPTHVDVTQSAALMRGLLGRAHGGRLLAVVHASLADRYAAYATSTGRPAIRHPGPRHVVLDVSR